MLRRAAVAGQFYAGTAEELRRQVEALWPSPAPVRGNAVGALVPHAGYMYSGRTAARVYALLPRTETYLLIGPNHTGAGARVSLAPPGEWETPLGRVSIDEALTLSLAEHCPEAKLDARAHAREHSLEVQVPFLQAGNAGTLRLAALLLGTQDPEILRAIGAGVERVVSATGGRVMLLASSDMNHFADDASTRALDRLALDRVLALDAAGLLETVHAHGISMCGAAPAAVVIRAVKGLGATRAELVDYTTSAETSGDLDRVVGYAGVLFMQD